MPKFPNKFVFLTDKCDDLPSFEEKLKFYSLLHEPNIEVDSLLKKIKT